MGIKGLISVSRPTSVIINQSALLHNLARIKEYAPGKKIFAMVKANAYGCGIASVVPVLDGLVDGFGVASIGEAMQIRHLGAKTSCILFQGVFSRDELDIASKYQFALVIHQEYQLEWLLDTPLPKPVSVWVKVNTGMSRLGFAVDALGAVVNALQKCAWVQPHIGVVSHFACADEPNHEDNAKQLALFNQINMPEIASKSMANSAAIVALSHAHADVVRPGIMLYGVSPLKGKTSKDLHLKPVMQFMSAVTAINSIPKGAKVGYGGVWQSTRPSTIAIVSVGYGDGYPRHIAENTPVWVRNREVMIVGRVSMDMIAIDITDHPDIGIGDSVELWGDHILVEKVAQQAGTIGYELLCQITERARKNYG